MSRLYDVAEMGYEVHTYTIVIPTCPVLRDRLAFHLNKSLLKQLIILVNTALIFSFI